MREESVRGKRKDNGKWVELLHMPHSYSVRYGRISSIFKNDDVLFKPCKHPVDSDTVGEGVKIDGNWYYEGDIFWDRHNEEFCVLALDETGFVFEYDGEIIGIETMGDMELCGNVWDNPELVRWYNAQTKDGDENGI